MREQVIHGSSPETSSHNLMAKVGDWIITSGFPSELSSVNESLGFVYIDNGDPPGSVESGQAVYLPDDLTSVYPLQNMTPQLCDTAHCKHPPLAQPVWRDECCKMVSGRWDTTKY